MPTGIAGLLERSSWLFCTQTIVSLETASAAEVLEGRRPLEMSKSHAAEAAMEVVSYITVQ